MIRDTTSILRNERLGRILAGLVLVAAMASSAAAADSRKLVVVFEPLANSSLSRLKAQIVIDAPVADVWRSITHYGGYGAHNAELKVTFVERKPDAGTRVNLVADLPWPLKAQPFHLDFYEDRKGYQVCLNQKCGGHSEPYTGSIALKGDGATTLLTLTFFVSPPRLVPKWAVKRVFKKNAAAEIDGIRKNVKLLQRQPAAGTK